MTLSPCPYDPITMPLWQYRAAGPITAAAAWANGCLYFGSNNGYVYSLSGADGSVQWAFQTRGEVRSTPLVLESEHTGHDSSQAGVLLVGSYDGMVYALNQSTGRPLWRYDTTSIVSGNLAQAHVRQLLLFYYFITGNLAQAHVRQL